MASDESLKESVTMPQEPSNDFEAPPLIKRPSLLSARFSATSSSIKDNLSTIFRRKPSDKEPKQRPRSQDSPLKTPTSPASSDSYLAQINKGTFFQGGTDAERREAEKAAQRGQAEASGVYERASSNMRRPGSSSQQSYLAESSNQANSQGHSQPRYEESNSSDDIPRLYAHRNESERLPESDQQQNMSGFRLDRHPGSVQQTSAQSTDVTQQEASFDEPETGYNFRDGSFDGNNQNTSSQNRHRHLKQTPRYMESLVESERTRPSDQQTRDGRLEQQVRESSPIDRLRGRRSGSQQRAYSPLTHAPIYSGAPDPYTRAEIYQSTFRGDEIRSVEAYRDERSQPRIRNGNQKLTLSAPTSNQTSGGTFPNTSFSQFNEVTPDPNVIIRRPRLPSIQTRYSSSNYSESTTSSQESGAISNRTHAKSTPSHRKKTVPAASSTMEHRSEALSRDREFGTPDEVEKEFLAEKEREESMDLHTGLHRLERSTNVVQHGSENFGERRRAMRSSSETHPTRPTHHLQQAKATFRSQRGDSSTTSTSTFAVLSPSSSPPTKKSLALQSRERASATPPPSLSHQKSVPLLIKELTQSEKLRNADEHIARVRDGRG